MNKCPKCSLEIDEGLTKCPACDMSLGGAEVPKKVKWYFRTTSIFVGFLMVGPLILPAVWVNPHYSRNKKIIVTIIIVLATWVLMVFAMKSIESIMKYYGTMGDLQKGIY